MGPSAHTSDQNKHEGNIWNCSHEVSRHCNPHPTPTPPLRRMQWPCDVIVKCRFNILKKFEPQVIRCNSIFLTSSAACWKYKITTINSSKLFFILQGMTLVFRPRNMKGNIPETNVGRCQHHSSWRSNQARIGIEKKSPNVNSKASSNAWNLWALSLFTTVLWTSLATNREKYEQNRKTFERTTYFIPVVSFSFNISPKTSLSWTLKLPLFF